MRTQRICSRIDNALGNDDGMTTYGHLWIDYQIPFMSDHSPMILNFHSVSVPTKVPFRFFNIWAEHEKFIDLIQSH